MRCPNCGSPVMVKEAPWDRKWQYFFECGYCGNSGYFGSRRTEPEPTAAPTQNVVLTAAFADKLDFEETWRAMKEAISQYAEELEPQLGELLIYEITHALAVPGHTTANEKFCALDRFLQENPVLRNGPDIRDILRASQAGEELYASQGKLTEDNCGTFWRQLIKKLPSGHDPETIESLLQGLGDVYQHFVTDDWNGESLTRFRELRDAFEYHWRYHEYLHPDLRAAVARLRRDDTSHIDDDCRDIMVTAFPDHFRDYTLEDMEDVQWNYLLEDLAEDDPALAQKMWETILSAAGPEFTHNPMVGESLLNASPFGSDWGNG